MQNNHALPETGYLRLPDVLRLFPVSRSTWWSGVKAGIYPRQTKLSPNVSAWKVEDIRALIEAAAVKNNEKSSGGESSAKAATAPCKKPSKDKQAVSRLDFTPEDFA